MRFAGNWIERLARRRKAFVAGVRAVVVDPALDFAAAWNEYRKGRRPVSGLAAAALALAAEIAMLLALIAAGKTVMSILVVGRKEFVTLQAQGAALAGWEPQSAIGMLLAGALALPVACILAYMAVGFVYNLYHDLCSKLLPPVARPVLLPLFIVLVNLGAQPNREPLGRLVGWSYLYVDSTVDRAHEHQVVRKRKEISIDVDINL